MTSSPTPQIESTGPVEPDAQGPLREGFHVADKYGLIEPIGTGSMGSVWKATHVMLGHTVAIKFLHASVEAYPDGRVRFEREAKLSARLGEASRHICKVSDFGVIGSTPFVVMELLKGEELSARLKRERQLPLSVIVKIVTQLCRALTVAHQAGVVHRDLKPANVFLCASEDGEDVSVKLLDFGVAKAALEHEDTQATRAGVIFGTPGYMSPEQIIAEEELDARSDLWSVAVMTYRMAAGRTPFGTGNVSELGMRILTTAPPPPSSYRPDLPKTFDDWMKKALAKKRDDRFATAAELAKALVEATADTADALVLETLEAEDLTMLEETVGEPAPKAADAPAVADRRRLKLRIAAAAVAFTVLMGVVIAAAIAGKHDDSEKRAAAAPASHSKATEVPIESKRLPELPPVSPVVSPNPPSPVVVAPVMVSPRETASTGASKAPTKAVKRDSDTRGIEKRAGELWNKKDEL